MIHYAPYGKNAAGKFNCGAISGGYTDNPSRVTCIKCKKRSPGLWPELKADERMNSLVEEIERLNKENHELRKLLDECDGEEVCRFCLKTLDEGHASDCRLAKALCLPTGEKT